MKRFKLIIALCIFVGALIACGESNTSEKTNSTNRPSESSKPAAPAQHFKAGDVVNIGKVWEMTISNVRVVSPGQYDSVKPGKMYLGMDVAVKNISDKEESLFGSAGWSLKDTQGQSYSTTYLSDYPNAPDGKIEPQGPAKGSLLFEVPEGTKEYRLAYENNMWSSGQAIWDITV